MKCWFAAAMLLLTCAAGARAEGAGPSPAQDGQAPAPDGQSAQESRPTLDVYGFAQADAIADFKQNDPNWFDVNRPSRLPSFAEQFGQNGNFYVSVRQSRFGVKGNLPAPAGPVNATFEFDMFGVGPDAGQTTIRLRHAWGQWKQVGAGQTNSQFMDVDVFPNVLDYWGPNGMLFFRNTQIFWQPYQEGDRTLTVAVERPGASGDAGIYADRIELQNVKARFPMPDFTGHYRLSQKWGHVQAGGALRYIAYDDLLPSDQFDLSGHVWGWGVSGSSNVKATPSDTLRLQVVYGHGIENYFNDAPIDVGLKQNPGNPVTPVVGEALPIFGLVVYVDHTWGRKWSTAAGYSRVDVSNSDAQAASAFKTGQYSSLNLLCTPATNVMLGGELQWARRANNSDGFTVNDVRLEFSVKYNFSYKLGG